MKYLLPLLLTLASTAHAANWVHVSTDINDNKRYIDTDSIQTHRFSGGGDYKTFWNKWEYSNTQKQDYPPYKSYNEVKAFEYYDCTAKRMEVESVHYYLNGQPVSSSSDYVPTSSSATWDRVVPDSVGEGKLDFVCRY